MDKYYEKYYRIIGGQPIKVDDKIWFSLYGKNGLCELDGDTKEIINLRLFKDESIAKEGVAMQVDIYNQKLIFTPKTVTKIYIFDLDTKELENIELRNSTTLDKQTLNKYTHFIQSFIHESYLFLVGFTYQAIVKVNLETYETEYITSFIDKIENSTKQGLKRYFYEGHVIIKNKVILPIFDRNAVLELDLITNETKIIELNLPFDSIGNIVAYNNESVVITGRRINCNNVIFWNVASGILDKYEIPGMEGDEYISSPFCAPVITNDKMYLFPMYANNCYEMDLNTKKIKISETLQKCICRKSSISDIRNVLYTTLQDDIIRFFSNITLSLYEYNVKTDECNEFIINTANDEYMAEYFNEIIKLAKEDENIVLEYKLPLEWLIKNQNQFEKKLTTETGTKTKTIGKLIYDELCK